MFVSGLKPRRVIPTVNVHTEKSRKEMAKHDVKVAVHVLPKAVGAAFSIGTKSIEWVIPDLLRWGVASD